MKKILFYLILLVDTFQIACSQNKESISIKQVSSSYSTILYANADKKAIECIRFYLAFDITNNTNEKIDVSFPEYIYNKKYTMDSYLGWIKSIPMYSHQNNKLEHVFSNKGLEKLEKKPKQYIFLTTHEPIQDSLIQLFFSSYLDKMKKENKDTLHIGTISELKQRNSPILQLLEGDSIVIPVNSKYIHIYPIPVQIK